ncbi:MAG: hypothetical protein NXY59_09525 [Aigarchaeota archaeon]|nr:hypothetical protein [Candidatus Pelearchaeum maunauluense]
MLAVLKLGLIIARVKPYFIPYTLIAPRGRMPTPLTAPLLTMALLLLAYQSPYTINTPIDDGEVDVVIVTPYGVVFNLTAIDGVFEMSRLVRGVYSLTAYWMDIPIGFFAVELRDGNKAANVRLAILSPSIQLTDLKNRPLNQAIIRYTGPAGIAGEIRTTDGTAALPPLPAAVQYTIQITWKSPAYKTESSTTIRTSLDGLDRMGRIKLPVGDVLLKVVDTMGRPIAGAAVFLNEARAKTDAEGRALFAQVPLESDGKPIDYRVVVRDGDEILFDDFVRLSTTTPEITIVVGLRDLSIFVRGSAGQPLAHTIIKLYREDKLVTVKATDRSGFAKLEQLVPAEYSLEVDWRGYTAQRSISREELMAGRPIMITLPPYIEILGIPLTFGTFIAFLAGIIALIILLVLGVIELLLWRGRRLGIYRA